MMPPRYRRGEGEGDPRGTRSSPETTVKVVCGEVEGVRGPVQDVVAAPQYLDVTVPSRLGNSRTPVKTRAYAIAYVLQGEG